MQVSKKKRGSMFKEKAVPHIIEIQRVFRYFPSEVCLVSGAPRSGTTAMCEWLGHQPNIAAFNETRVLISAHKLLEEAYRFKNLEKENRIILNLVRHFVMDYYANCGILIGKTVVLDKEPLEPIALPLKDYEKFLLNVRNLFPRAKFLLMIRDPLATIWSMANRTWGESLTIAESREFTLREYAENWCSCADLILKYRADPNTYVATYRNLVTDPVHETMKVLEFLGVKNGKPFLLKRAKEIGFSVEQKEQILQLVRPQLEMLHVQGIL